MMVDNLSVPGDTRHAPLLVKDGTPMFSRRSRIRQLNRGARPQRRAMAKHKANEPIPLDELLIEGSFDLRDYDISIEGPEKAAGITLAKGRRQVGGAPAACPMPLSDANGWQDISWIVNMEDVCGYGVVDPACLTAAPPRAVGSRLSLTAGALGCKMPLNDTYMKKVWEFMPSMGPIVRQAIADVVVYSVQARSLTLVLTPFEGAAGSDPILVTLAEPDSKKTVKLFIENDPVDPQPQDPRTIPHFAAQYFLLPKGRRPSTPPIPHAVSDTVNCPESKSASATIVSEDRATVLLSEPNYCPMSLCFTR
jgi:hypothetical protein